MSSLLNTLKADLYRHEKYSGVGGFIKGWFKFGFRYMLVYRLIQFQPSYSPLLLPLKIMRRWFRISYGFEIDANAKIGEGFYLTDHIGHVIIGPVIIGKYCNVSHGVTIGRAYDKNGVAGRPVLGDRVWVGTGAVLVGKIKIGNNVLIAPNTFLNIDVPDNSIAIGNPAKIISKDNPTKLYINNVFEDEISARP
jgi:serine O-acetyltransferase